MTNADSPSVYIISENGSDSNWLGTCRSLAKERVKVYRFSPYSWYSSKYCQTILSPKIYENPGRYLNFLTNHGKETKRKHEKPLLFPTSDNSLILLSKNIHELSKYYTIIAPEWSTTEKIVDKSLTYQVAESLGINVPMTLTPRNLEELKKDAKEMHYPCLLKPAHSHIFNQKFKIKLFKMNSQSELIEKYLLLQRKGLKMVIQEEVPGPDENNYMFSACLNKDSKPLGFVTSRKIRQNPPIYGVGSLIKSIWAPDLVKKGMKILQKLGFFGIADIDFKVDSRTEEIKLLEINGRSYTQIQFATHCGQNLPLKLYKELTGEPQSPVDQDVCDFKLGEKWVHLMLDGLSMIEKRRNKEITLMEWCLSLRGIKSYAIYSFNDPKPFLSEMNRILHQISNPHNYLNK